MNNITILPFAERHAAEAGRIEQLCFSDPWPPEEFFRLCQNPGEIFFAAEIPGTLPSEPPRLAGYAGFWPVDWEADILNIAVHPDYRRKGIGGALLDAILCYAAQTGVTTLNLEVRCSNESAASLYRSRGFLPVGIRRRYYTRPQEDACLMQLVLPVNKSAGNGSA